MLVILADTPAEVKQQTQDWLEWELNRARTEVASKKGVRQREKAIAVANAIKQMVDTYAATGLSPKRADDRSVKVPG